MDDSMIRQPKERIQQLIQMLYANADKVAITIVANVISQTKRYNDYNSYSVSAEFFSDREIAQLIEGLHKFGIYSKVYYDEFEFIREVLSDSGFSHQKEFHVVYNTAQKGTGAGRKSLIPSLCNSLGIAYTSSDAYVSSLCRHKFHYNRLLNNAGFPMAESWWYRDKYGWINASRPKNGTKVILKPTYESSSIGIDESSITTMSPETEGFLNALCHKFNQPITVQQFVPGYEIEVPVIVDVTPMAIAPIGINILGTSLIGNQILNYERRFKNGYEFYEFNEFGSVFNQKLMRQCEKVVEYLGIEGLGRVDFRVTESGQALITDIATSPHITRHSSYAFLFESMGLSKELLVAVLVAICLERFGLTQKAAS